MTPVVAILDANVLYPASLRDVLLQMAVAGFYQARWSAEIDEEWKRNLLAARPELTERIEQTQAVMRRAIPDALVTDYASRIPELMLPDPHDHHVVAAAIAAKAEIIVTFNIRDFPAAALSPHGLVAQHPDEFLQGFIAMMPNQFIGVVRRCIARLTNPPVAATVYLETLRRLQLQETAAFLASNLADWEP